ncbi:putative STAG domain-containing protein, partial [Cardiosporidium cionae]
IKAKDLQKRMRSLFLGILEMETNSICNFGVFLSMMTLAQLETVLFSTEEGGKPSSSSVTEFSYSLADQEALFNTLNTFLRDIEASSNVDDRLVWMYDEIHPPSLFPLCSYSPVLDMAKDTEKDTLSTEEQYRTAQKLHMAITCCQFVVNSNNPYLWQSNLGTLILIQINMNQERIALQAYRFVQLLKKQSIEKFFQIVLRSLIILHSAVLSEDLTHQEVLAFSSSLAYRIGISLSVKTKIALCKFIFDALVYSVNVPQYEVLLEYLYPFAIRRFLTKQEVEFLASQLQKEMESRQLVYEESAAEKLMAAFLKKSPEKQDEAQRKTLHSVEVENSTEIQRVTAVEMPLLPPSSSPRPSPRLSLNSAAFPPADLSLERLCPSMEHSFDEFPSDVNDAEKSNERKKTSSPIVEKSNERKKTSLPPADLSEVSMDAIAEEEEEETETLHPSPSHEEEGSES